MPDLLDWEHWIIESPSPSRYPNGSRVQANAPVRLKNKQWQKWLAVTNTGDVVLLSTPSSTAQLRFNGGLQFR
jgi:hypothetical protein